MGQCLQTTIPSEGSPDSNTTLYPSLIPGLAPLVGPEVNLTENGNMKENFSKELECQLYTFIIYVAIFGSMVVFGLVGNTLSFVVLNMDRQIHAATFLLQTMAIVDNAFLLTTGVSQILPAYSLFVEDRHHPLMAYLIKYVHPLVHVTQLATVWITVLISFNRFIAICIPFRAPMLCTMTRIRIQVATMFVLILLYNVPRFCEHCIDYVVDPVTNLTLPQYRPSSLQLNRAYNVIYENILYCLFVFLGPLGILILLNTCLIRELLRARRRLASNQMTSRRVSKAPDKNPSGPLVQKPEDQEQNITLVMIVIVLVFLFCQTPAYLNQLLYYVLGSEEYECGTAYFYYYHVSNLIVSANSTLNFVIYCVFRRQFRQRLYVLCGRRKNCCSSSFSGTFTTTSVRSRRRDSWSDGAGAHQGSVYTRVSCNPPPNDGTITKCGHTNML